MLKGGGGGRILCEKWFLSPPIKKIVELLSRLISLPVSCSILQINVVLFTISSIFQQNVIVFLLKALVATDVNIWWDIMFT